MKRQNEHRQEIMLIIKKLLHHSFSQNSPHVYTINMFTVLEFP